MSEDTKVVMLHEDLKGFYISSIELEVLIATHALDQKIIRSVKVQNEDFDKVIDLEDLNVRPTTFGKYISDIEQDLNPNQVMIISFEFDNDTHLHFQTGELSISSTDPDFIQTIAIELLDLCGYQGIQIFEKLKSNKHFYISISEDSEFDYLYPHPGN